MAFQNPQRALALAAALVLLGPALAPPGAAEVALFLGSPTGARLVPPSAVTGSYFGLAVAADGDTIATTWLYLVEVYVRSGQGWVHQASLNVFDLNSVRTLSLSGDTLVAGGPFASQEGYFSGAAAVFTRSGGTWTRQATLRADDAASRAEGRNFGYDVAVHGDTAAIGAPAWWQPGPGNPGAVYVFQRSGTTWTKQAKLTASDGRDYDRFGWSVALEGDRLVAGSPDRRGAYVFARSGTAWTEEAKLTPGVNDPQDWFGHEVALRGGLLAVGAPRNPFQVDVPAGKVWPFVRVANDWQRLAAVGAPDASDGDHFGHRLVLSGSSLTGATLVVGAPGPRSEGRGAAYVLLGASGAWAPPVVLKAADGEDGDGFGREVGWAAGTAVVGAPFDDTAEGMYAGSVHTFRSTVHVKV